MQVKIIIKHGEKVSKKPKVKASASNDIRPRCGDGEGCGGGEAKVLYLSSDQ